MLYSLTALELAVDLVVSCCQTKRTWREVVEKDCQACKLNKGMLWIIVDEVDKGCLMIRIGVCG